MKLAHLALWTRDLEEAARFWRGWFDAEVGPRYDSRNRPGFSSRFATIAGGAVQLELMEGQRWSQDFGPVAKLQRLTKD